MTISNKFGVLLAEKEATEKRNIPISEVARATGLMRQTLQSWANNTVTRYDAPVIDSLCNYFNCTPGDLIVKIG
jgi:putative transcriptional regulator